MKRINLGLAVALLTLAAASSIVLKSPNESADAQDVETGFRPLVAQMETLLQTHHFNRDALQGEHYDNTLAALYALAETAPDQEAFLDGFRTVRAEGPFSHVNLMPSNNTAAEMSAYFDAMNVGPEAKDLSFVDNIAVLSVHTMMGQDTVRFIENAFEEIVAHEPDALIIDLRRNEGGAFAMRPTVSGMIENPVDAGYFISRRWTDHNEHQPTRADIVALDPWAGCSVREFWDAVIEEAVIRVRFLPSETVYRGPVYVLTSEATASAAEMAVEALQAAGRVQVIGEPTAGQMLSQRPFDLDGGFLLFLPIADYYSLNTGRIEGHPVQPDIRVDADQALARAMELARE